jgi:ankyrin repeat protein
MFKRYLILFYLCVSMSFTESDTFELAEKGDLNGLRGKVEAGTDLMAVNDWGETVLHYAARSGSLELVDYLVWKLRETHPYLIDDQFEVWSRAKMQNDSDYMGQTALHYAAKSGDYEMVRTLAEEFPCYNEVILVENRANIFFNQYDQTVLHYAVESGSLELVEYLVYEFDADITAKNSSGQTAYDIAEHNNYSKIVELLVKTNQ